MRRRLYRLGLVLLSILLGAAAVASPWGWHLEEQIGLDLLFQLRGPLPAPEKVAIIRLDEASLAAFRKLPREPTAWPSALRECAERYSGLERLPAVRGNDRIPRTVHACVIDVLSAYRARVIVFDIMFRDDPDRNHGTEALAAAMRAHGRVVVHRSAERRLERVAGHVGTGLIEHRLGEVHPVIAAAVVTAAPFTLPSTGEPVRQVWTFHPQLDEPTQLPVRVLEASAQQELMPLPTSSDPGMAGQRANAMLHEAVRRVYRLQEQHYLNFYGYPGTVPSIGLYQLLSGDEVLQPIAEQLRDGTVFVGSLDLDYTTVEDTFPTPFSTQRGMHLSGAEIAATAFANLRDDRMLRLPGLGLGALLVGGLSGLLTLLAVWRTCFVGAATAVAAALLYAAAAMVAFFHHDLWLPLVTPLLMLVAAIGIGQLWHRWLGEKALEAWVPASVVAAVRRGQEIAGTQPREGIATVMFTDMVGSTALLHDLPLAEVRRVVNEHCALLTRCIEQTGGIVTQFNGDGVMAYWGLGRTQPDHAARACRAALDIMAALRSDNAERAARGDVMLRVRIGINTGPVVAGTMGAPGRGPYTLVGDTVNMTQRLEQSGKLLCPDQPVATVLLSSETGAMVRGEFELLNLGAQALKGYAGKVEIHRLIARSQAAKAAA